MRNDKARLVAAHFIEQRLHSPNGPKFEIYERGVVEEISEQFLPRAEIQFGDSALPGVACR